MVTNVRTRAEMKRAACEDLLRITREDPLLWIMSGLECVLECQEMEPSLYAKAVKAHAALLLFYDLQHGGFMRDPEFYPWALRWLARID